MKFLVSAPLSKTLDGKAVIVTGSGLNWEASQVTLATLLAEAKRNVRYENVELKVLSAGKAPSAPKDKLIFGDENSTRLWIDTKPYGPSRFTTGLVTIVQEIRAESNSVLGYVVVFPDGRILKVAEPDLLNYCENARVQGRNAVQNMQYVRGTGTTVAHLKNYEGRTVPVYIQYRKAVNAEKTPVKVPTPEPAKPSAATVFTPEQLKILGQGKTDGVKIKVYANPALSPKHMDIIRQVLVQKKDPTLILDPNLPEELVSLYGYDLAAGADIRPYYNPAYTLKQAIQVKLGVIRGLDVSKYASPTTDGDEMEQLRVRMDADMWSGITND